MIDTIILYRDAQHPDRFRAVVGDQTKVFEFEELADWLNDREHEAAQPEAEEEMFSEMDLEVMR